jgi:WD40 repeat protein/transcriptional regulator with XRE-family HTH domain
MISRSSRSISLAQENKIWVRATLKKRGLTVKEFAEKCGLSKATIDAFFACRPIDYSSLLSITDALGIDWEKVIAIEIDNFAQVPPVIKNQMYDWGDASDNSLFYGRLNDLEHVERLIVKETANLIAILGIGGIGKTSFTIKLAKRVAPHFTHIIWRSLKNAPPAENIVDDLLHCFTQKRASNLPEDFDAKIAIILEKLSSNRCLVILDNFETILQEGDRVGKYREGYKDYTKILAMFGEASHRSCLLVTSREKPKSIELLELTSSSAQSYLLNGLTDYETQQIYSEQGITSSLASSWHEITEKCTGNPLILKIVGSLIKELFVSDATKFLSDGKVVFEDVQTLLNEQFKRLSDGEQQIIYWLAIERETVSSSSLRNNIVPHIDAKNLQDNLVSLKKRFLIEQSHDGMFTLQPVVMEYTTDLLIHNLHQEIRLGKIDLLNRLAILKAQSKDYVRQSQSRLIRTPLLNLLEQFSSVALKKQLTKILDMLRSDETSFAGYAAGNILNIAEEKFDDLSQFDFSKLTVLQAYLQDSAIHNVNFSDAHIAQSMFTEVFSRVCAIAFSNNGSKFLIGDIKGEIHLFDTREQRVLNIIKAHSSYVSDLILSPDDTMLASSSDDGTVKIWNISTGQLLEVLKASQRVWSVRFSSDGSVLAYGDDNGLVMLWNTKTRKYLKTSHISGNPKRTHSIAFHPSQRILAVAGGDSLIRLLDLESGAFLKEIEGHQDDIFAVIFSSDGKLLASGSYDNSIRLWDAATGRCLHKLEGHTAWIYDIVFSDNGDLIISGSDDHTVRVWNTQTGECVNTLRGHQSAVFSVKFIPNTRIIASGSFDFTFKYWDIYTGQCLKTIKGYGHHIWSIAYSINGEFLVSGNDNHTVGIWDIHTGKSTKVLYGHSNSVWTVSISPNSQLIASAGDDHVVKIWDAQSGRCLKTLHGHNNWIMSVTFSSDSQKVISGGNDHKIRIWDANTGECLRTLHGHKGRLRFVQTSSDGCLIASSGADSLIKLWNIETGVCLKTLEGHTNWVLSLAFSPDDKILISGSKDGIVKVWDVKTGNCIKTLASHSDQVRSIAFNPCLPVYATASFDKTVKIWSSHTHQLLCKLGEDEGLQHTSWVCSIAFSADGFTLVSSSSDETMRLWDMSTFKHLKTIRPIRPYEGMNINGVTGLTPAEAASLKALGAIGEPRLT